ncbi:unnamed protein product [Scytosiphon promiscuus]
MSSSIHLLFSSDFSLNPAQDTYCGTKHMTADMCDGAAREAGASSIEAEPSPCRIAAATTALVVIDMQRDFLEPGGFGESLGNDVSLLRTAISPCAELLSACRDSGLLVVHTREGHRPDLSDLPTQKFLHGPEGKRIGDLGPMGRILVRGETGHDIVPELYPLPLEPVVDKPGKGAFFATDLHTILRSRGIQTLLVCGVTTEVCVQATVREANDRGFACVVAAEACSSFFPEFHTIGLAMIKAQGGILGRVASVANVVKAVKQLRS